MGTRGPKPLPANVLRLRGASHVAKGNIDGGVDPPAAIPGIPRHLLPEAKKFWRKLAPKLLAEGLVAEIDQAALSLVCNEWAHLVWFEKALEADKAAAAARQERHEAAEQAKVDAATARGDVYTPLPWTGGNGVMLPTPAGNWTYNPNWVARNKHAQMLDRFLASFGMSPSSRGRVTPSTRQLDLGLQEPAPKEGFAAL